MELSLKRVFDMAVQYRCVGENTMQYAVQDGAAGGRDGGCDRAESRVNIEADKINRRSCPHTRLATRTFLRRTRNLAHLRKNPPPQVFKRSAKLWGVRAPARYSSVRYRRSRGVEVFPGCPLNLRATIMITVAPARFTVHTDCGSTQEQSHEGAATMKKPSLNFLAINH